MAKRGRPRSKNITNLGPKKIRLKHFLSPGDVVMLTAAVRDLHKAYPGKFLTDIQTSCDAIWENNPYITKFDKDDKSVMDIECEYELIHRSNQSAYHFIHGFHMDLEEKLGLRIPVTEFKGDIHISDTEKSWYSQVHEMGIEDDFWIIMGGGKYDFTCKWWNPDYYQEVVDYFSGKITFVQCGEKGHWHPPLNKVIDLIGKTDMRQFIRLIYNSVGVISPVTFAMHAAAAIEMKKSPPLNRPCVVISGGREPVQWEMYPHHRFHAVNGCLDCCDYGGCWKSRCQKVGDGDEKDEKDLCSYPVKLTDDLSIPKCMNMIKPVDVIRSIECWYEGGVLEYNKQTPNSPALPALGDSNMKKESKE